MAEAAISLKRVKVTRSDRILVLERIIRELAPQDVLELGAGDYSFDYVAEPSRRSWTKVDCAEPCDVIYDFNQQRVRLPFAAASLDLVICTEVLEHLMWPQALLAEAHRLLRPGAHVLISVPNAVSLTYRVGWMFGHIPSCAACGNLSFGPTAYVTETGETIAGHVIDFSVSRLKTLLRQTGFEVERMTGGGLYRKFRIAPHWMLPASLSSNLICLARRVDLP